MNARPRLTKLDDLELRLEVTNLGTPYIKVINEYISVWESMVRYLFLRVSTHKAERST